MSTPNPAEDVQSPPAVSSKTFSIAGILTTVYGLEELSATCKSISCLWLLHGRLQKKETMASCANTCIRDWNQRPSSDQKVGFIAVAFDQRNHGTREVTPFANQSWRDGNQAHAQDMFSIYHGTVMDVSLLIDHLGSYIFHGPNSPSIDQHLTLGISLGGHAAWQLVFNEPRITAAVVIIGCPDYMNLMTDRARLSKINTSGPILGSTHFPQALINSLEKFDPKGILFSTSPVLTSVPSIASQSRFREIFDARIRNKKILICSGGADKLVPYRCSEDFLNFLTTATDEKGWYADGNVYVENNVYAGIGHAYSDEMVQDTVRFVSDVLAGGSGAGSGPLAKI